MSAVAHSLCFFYNSPELGADFIRRFFGEMSLPFRAINGRCSTGSPLENFPLPVLFRGVEEAAKRQGLPVKMFDANAFREGALSVRLRARRRSSAAPHPSAAKVALNGLLSREGQIGYQTVYAKAGEARESMREDIPKDLIPASSRRVKAEGTSFRSPGMGRYGAGE